MYSSIDSAAPRSSSGMASPQRIPPSRSRAQSISSDRPSTVAHSLMSPPLAVSPEPAFIAASAASQIVTNDHDSHAEAWYDQHGIEPSGETAAVSPAALQLVNSFLDQLLFNFLCVSRSTALSALRPAVSEVLKPKLAKDAINQADEELREYLGGEDELPAEAQGQDPVSAGDWDVELVWKRTRLRCMVYSSLGDMEEEDEDFYMEQGHLETGTDDRLSEAVSPAVAIFLTSILEFMGEQALIVAGQAAYHRMRVKYDKELKEGARSPTGVADKIVVEELDMERVALDRTLGRLWRSWKKKIRSPAAGAMERLARSFSGDSMRGAGHLRSPSSTAELMVPATVLEPEAGAEDEVEHAPAAAQEAAEGVEEPMPTTMPMAQEGDEYLTAAAIPLPMGPNDVEEIEVPGLAPAYEQEDNEGEKEDGDGGQGEQPPGRPKSMIILPLATGLLTPASSRPQTPTVAHRKRSNSLPTPVTTPYLSPIGAPAAPSDENQPATDAPEGAVEDHVQPSRETAARVQVVPPIVPPIVTQLETVEEDRLDEEEEEVSIEEPRIIRSSRVSILGGRNPSPTFSENGRPTMINTNLPVRSPSIHSARLIEVTSPRSPVVTSARNSLVATDSSRGPSPSRLSGAGTPPIPDERPRRSPDSTSRSRLSVNHAQRSGSENENDYAVSPVTPISPGSGNSSSLPVILEATSREHREGANTAAEEQEARSVAPPANAERATTPSSQKALAKVAVLPSASSSPSRPSTAASSVFYIESMPVLAEGKPAKDKQWAKSSSSRPSTATASPPVVPERSAGRQAVANTSAQRQPATIGLVSVERSRNDNTSPEAPGASSKQQRGSGSPGSTKIKPVRTSEEGMQARIDVVRNFEELIQSDQTIQYTLTPENMRDNNSQSSTRQKGSGSPVISVKTRKSEDMRQSTPRSRSSSAVRPGEMGGVGGTPGSNNNNNNNKPRSVGHVHQQSTDTHHSLRSYPTSTSKHGGVVPRSTPPGPSKPRGNIAQARDARLPRESMAEFAEFIRSTGPPGGGAAPVNALAGPGGSRNPGMVSMASVASSKGSMTSNPNRPRLQARDAAVDYKDDNSDLIDFIRRGPPSHNPRIPKAVAPFRSTMDSDQMTGAVGGRAVDAHLNEAEMRGSDSTNSVPPSIQSSINSQSALLAGGRNKPLPTTSHPAPTTTPNEMDFDMPMPKRKTRRVRDPYAIDLSDEDEMMMLEEELTPKPKRPVAKEESLIDFLNNYAPPPEPTVLPFATQETQAAAARNKPKKKSSSASLMARLTRRDSGQGGGSAPGFMGGSKAAQLPTAESRSLSSRASGGVGATMGGRSYTPIQVVPNMGSKAAAMMGGNPAPSTTNRPPVGGSGRVPMKRFEPRDAVSVPSRGTSDLADFLKHSGPPPGITMAAPFPEPMSPEQHRRRESNSISKVFGRRKKPSIS
ncbi:hypothetical protein QBC41DRAFT_73669 [Cercophora samala]|uniref:Flo11 n=1 Tax=Cercophora samala TaxID=330535 RepID=A0AA39ZGL1_9PEZI|nr:hypothetical protein QBC41DRAFT_73669 [Cercophora samala]